MPPYSECRPPYAQRTEYCGIPGRECLFFRGSGNTVACGCTCHIPANAGADPRIARNPGPDGQLLTPDDKLGSAGMIRSDGADNSYAGLELCFHWYVVDPGGAGGIAKSNIAHLTL